MGAKDQVLGIIDEGQLGQMLAHAAKKLGHTVIAYAPNGDNPTSRASDVSFTGNYGDLARIEAFAREVRVVTSCFENVPAASLKHVSRFAQTAPTERAFDVAQDRLIEKGFAKMRGVKVTPYIPFDTGRYPDASDIDSFLNEEEGEGRGFLKTRRLGYDGKGQIPVHGAEEVYRAFEALKRVPCILERHIPFAYEISVIVARDQHGGSVSYPAVRNRHENGILRQTLWQPGLIPDDVERKAREATLRLAEALQLVGLLAVEFFVTNDGKPLFNEMAPRPHNSGHWTIDACEVSQFTNLVLALTGERVRDPEPFAKAEMRNLLGFEAAPPYGLRVEDTKGCEVRIHDYGKEPRPGRKVGHVTLFKPLQGSATCGKRSLRGRR